MLRDRRNLRLRLTRHWSRLRRVIRVVRVIIGLALLLIGCGVIASIDLRLQRYCIYMYILVNRTAGKYIP